MSTDTALGALLLTAAPATGTPHAGHLPWLENPEGTAAFLERVVRRAAGRS